MTDPEQVLTNRPRQLRRQKAPAETFLVIKHDTSLISYGKTRSTDEAESMA